MRAGLFKSCSWISVAKTEFGRDDDRVAKSGHGLAEDLIEGTIGFSAVEAHRG